MVTTNQKSMTDTHKKIERNTNITLKIVIKSQVKRAKEEEMEQKIKTTRKQLTKWQ